MGAVHRPFNVPPVKLARSNQQQVAFFYLETALGFRPQDVVGHDALTAFHPVDSPDQGNIHQYGAGNDAVFRLFDRSNRGPHAGRDEVGGLAVVGLALPKEMGQAVHMGNGDAVEYHAEVVHGHGVRPGRNFIAPRPAFPAFGHEVDRWVRRVNRGFERNGPGQRDGQPLLDRG